MRIWMKLASAALCAAGASTVLGQTATGVFTGPTESFETIAAGPYLSASGVAQGFAGFSGSAHFTTVGAGFSFVNDIQQLLPAFSGTKTLYGRGADLRIRFSGGFRRFGGRFRVPTDGAGVTTMRVFFYRNGVLVGSPVTAAISGSAWTWRGWDCGAVGGFDEVRIFGNGRLPGFVGMDHLVVSHPIVDP